MLRFVSVFALSTLLSGAKEHLVRGKETHASRSFGNEVSGKEGMLRKHHIFFACGQIPTVNADFTLALRARR
jgi:hypothetical protein